MSGKKKAAFLASVLVFGLGYVVFSVFHPQTINLPKSILQLRLTEEIRGKQAQEIIDALHKKSLTPEVNAIGSYFSTDGGATLYVSHYASRKKAEEQLAVMAAIVLSGNEAFTRFRIIQLQGHDTYLCYGLGQAHYIFLYENDLYWWASDVQLAHASAQELVRILHQDQQK
jgi:hypothetical protein